MVMFWAGCAVVPEYQDTAKQNADMEKAKETVEHDALTKEEINANLNENEVAVRHYTRKLSTIDLLKSINKNKSTRSIDNIAADEEQTSDNDVFYEETENEFINFYNNLDNEGKYEFEKYCEEGEVDFSVDFVSTIEVNDSSELSSDYIQTMVTQGELLREIEEAFDGEEVIVIDESDGAVPPANMSIYRQTNNLGRGALDKSYDISNYISIKKYSPTRGVRADNEVKMDARVIATLFALMNCRDELIDLYDMFDKDIDLNKLDKYHSLMNNGLLTRGGSSGSDWYDESLIADEEIQKKVSESVLKTGQFICTAGKSKKKGSVYGTYNHGGLIDLRNYTDVKNDKITASIWSPIVLSSYPSGDSYENLLAGKRMPEKLGYPSFEPIANFTMGDKVALLEPLNKSKMDAAVNYAVNTYNKCDQPYDLFKGTYCSYMPYAGYASQKISINSDPYNEYPAIPVGLALEPLVPTSFILYGILRAVFGKIITPDDIYNSQNNRYRQMYVKVKVPVKFKYFVFKKFMQIEWREKTYYIYGLKHENVKIYSRQSELVLSREQK